MGDLSDFELHGSVVDKTRFLGPHNIIVAHSSSELCKVRVTSTCDWSN